MRNISSLGSNDVTTEARRLRELIIAMSRRRSLRDPIASTCATIVLTPPQIHSVLWLGHDGPLTMGELARRIGITEKTITGVVDRLEREGYLQRERDPGDRRVVRVRLTRKGAETYRRIDTEIDDKVKELLSLLDPPDRRDLFRILEKLQERLGDRPEGA